MAKLLIDENFNNFEEESNEEIDVQANDIYEYKGYFLENNIDDEE